MIGMIIFGVIATGQLCLLALGIGLPIIDTIHDRRRVRATRAEG